MLHHQEQWAKNKPMSASLKMYNMLRWVQGSRVKYIFTPFTRKLQNYVEGISMLKWTWAVMHFILACSPDQSQLNAVTRKCFMLNESLHLACSPCWPLWMLGDLWAVVSSRVWDRMWWISAKTAQSLKIYQNPAVPKSLWKHSPHIHKQLL